MTTDLQATTPAPADTSSTILVLHNYDLNPLPFLSRLTTTDIESDPLRDTVPWTIDNKYYTADVQFRVQPLGLSPGAHPVVLYLFSGSPPDPLPATLTRLAVLDPPPDISLGVRVNEAEAGAGAAEVTTDADIDTDPFDEIGMEVVDELGAADEDDERPLDPLETVRQTLMTHMWPNMQRKPAGGRNAPRPDIVVNAGGDESGDEGTTRFPVTFSTRTPEPREAGPASDFPTPEPSADDGYMPVSNGGGGDDDDDDFGGFNSGAGGVGPGAEQYARLDAWLDNDVDVDGGELDAGNGANADDDDDDVAAIIAEAMRHIPPGMNGHNGLTLDDEGFADMPEENGFDDDFGPAPTTRGGPGAGGIALDPTPILLHLQQVRAELAQVENENERRVRAAEEVMRLMASLGMGSEGGVGDWDDPLEGIDGEFGDEGLQRLERLERLDEM